MIWNSSSAISETVVFGRRQNKNGTLALINSLILIQQDCICNNFDLAFLFSLDNKHGIMARILLSFPGYWTIALNFDISLLQISNLTHIYLYITLPGNLNLSTLNMIWWPSGMLRNQIAAAWLYNHGSICHKKWIN